MTVKAILRSVGFDSLWERMTGTIPFFGYRGKLSTESAHMWARYKPRFMQAYAEILSTPENTAEDLSAVLVQFESEEVGALVHGKAADPNDPNQTYAIEYTDWEELVGLPVLVVTQNGREIPEDDLLQDWDLMAFVAAEILYELTWAGFSRREIQERWKALEAYAKAAEAEIPF